MELLLSKTDNIFKSMEIVEKMFEGVVEPSSKKILEKIITMLVAQNKREEKTRCQKIILRWVNVLAIANKYA